MVKNQHVLILPNIRSALNVGAIFRTADAVGISKIYLVGYTPTPSNTDTRAQKDIEKTALGAESYVSWEHKKTLLPLVRNLKKDNYEVVALEQDDRSIDYRKYKLKKDKKIAIILGSEVEGIDKSILKECDSILEIPMYGQKESLNVSVSCGILLFRVLRP